MLKNIKDTAVSLRSHYVYITFEAIRKLLCELWDMQQMMRGEKHEYLVSVSIKGLPPEDAENLMKDMSLPQNINRLGEYVEGQSQCRLELTTEVVAPTGVAAMAIAMSHLRENLQSIDFSPEKIRIAVSPVPTAAPVDFKFMSMND